MSRNDGNQTPTYAAQHPKEQRPQPHRGGSLKSHMDETVRLYIVVY